MAWQDEDEELDEAEDPDESDQNDEDDGGDVTLPCPNCGEQVWEEAERCPNCGEYITPSVPTYRKPWWVIVAAILALLAALLWLAF